MDWAETDWRACFDSPSSRWPSINLTLRPLANAVASLVNVPEVTTNPPVSPFAAVTPYNSRTTGVRERRCTLHPLVWWLHTVIDVEVLEALRAERCEIHYVEDAQTEAMLGQPFALAVHERFVALSKLRESDMPG